MQRFKKTEPAAREIELLDRIPGIGRRSAERILAETGINMEQFQSAAHFASWVGLVLENNESAGKKKSTKIRKGNKFLKATLVECARVAIRNKDSFFYARYKKSREAGRQASTHRNSSQHAASHIQYVEKEGNVPRFEQ